MEEVGISSIRELGRKAGISHGTITAAKNNLKPPTRETAEALCRALKVDWVELWTRAGYVDRYRIPSASELEGLDAEIYRAMQGTGDDFKRVVLKTIKIWLSFYQKPKKEL